MPQHPSGNQAEHIAVAFDVDGNRIETRAPVEWAENFPIDSTVEVAYDRNNPKRVWPLRGGYDPANDSWFTTWSVVAVFLLTIAFWVVGLRSLRVWWSLRQPPRKMLATVVEVDNKTVIALYDPEQIANNKSAAPIYCRRGSADLKYQLSTPLTPVTVHSNFRRFSRVVVNDDKGGLIAIARRQIPKRLERYLDHLEIQNFIDGIGDLIDIP